MWSAVSESCFLVFSDVWTQDICARGHLGYQLVWPVGVRHIFLERKKRSFYEHRFVYSSLYKSGSGTSLGLFKYS